MSQRLNEYFAGEATDYLQQLAAVLAAPVPPDPVRLLRLTTGVRGSTQMAGGNDLAELAGRFERTARDVLDGSASWSDDLGQLGRRTVTEILELIPRISNWGDDESGRVNVLLEAWSSTMRAEDPSQAVPISALFFDDEGPHVVEEGAYSGGPAVQVVPIEELLLRGDRALHSALALRSAFDAAANGPSEDGRLPELVDELFDLLELSLTNESAEA